MYGIYANIYHQYTPNVSIYTIHGSYGRYIKCPIVPQKKSPNVHGSVLHGPGAPGARTETLPAAVTRISSSDLGISSCELGGLNDEGINRGYVMEI